MRIELTLPKQLTLDRYAMKRGVSSETLAKNLLESALIEIEREMADNNATVPFQYRTRNGFAVEVSNG